MARVKKRYKCSNCGRVTPAFMGRCPQCGEFDTMREEIVAPEPHRGARRPVAARGAPQRLKDVKASRVPRMQLPMQEFGRVLGGGIVPGSLVLLGGDPGIGKSTLLLQVAAMVAEAHGTVLYVSGEESLQQIKMRAERVGLEADALYLASETSVEAMLDHVDSTKPLVLIVDSIQTCTVAEVSSSPGSVSQVRASAGRFQELAKSSGVTVFLVGHVTKEGAIAGPRVLEHIVDTVLYLEGDMFHRFRLLRSVKNRFGATSEVGVFEMAGAGMVEVLNPSEAFLAERQVNASGSAIAVTLEGTRPLLVELQALVSATPFSNPRRTANGIDYNRLLLLSAVLTRRGKLKLFDKDIFVNVVGGLQIGEPAADLAVAAAIASSLQDRPVAADLALVGEIGLSGELRAVSQLAMRLREAEKLGFRRCIVPRSLGKQDDTPPGLEVIRCRSVQEALDVALLKP